MKVKRSPIKDTPMDKLTITIGSKYYTFFIDRELKDITAYTNYAKEQHES